MPLVAEHLLTRHPLHKLQKNQSIGPVEKYSVIVPKPEEVLRASLKEQHELVNKKAR